MKNKKTTPKGRFKQTEFLQTHYGNLSLKLTIRDVHSDFKAET